MNIKIKFKERKLSEELNRDELEGNEESILKDNLFLEMNRYLLKKLNEKKITIENDIFKNYDIEFPSVLNFEVIFMPEESREDVIYNFEIDTPDPLGFHAITTGEGLVKQESYYNGKFQVFVFCPNNEKYVNDILNDASPLNYLHSSLNTLTHELSHMIVFAKSSGGLSPKEVDCLYEASEFDNDISDCTLGCNLDEYEEFYVGNGDLSLNHNNILEEIVEREGFELLNSLHIDFNNLLEKIEIKNILMLEEKNISLKF